jgi:hypothetical protein
MEVEQAKEKKEKLAKSIANTIYEFEKETGCKVERIDIIRNPSFFEDKTPIISLTIEV